MLKPPSTVHHPQHRDRRAVSEVIANILLLAITITLFMSIFYWVTNLPPPQSKPRVDISGTLSILPDNSAYINLTYLNGDPLYGYSTVIYVGINNAVTLSLTLQSGGISDDIFNIGERWIYHDTVNTYSPQSRVEVMIIDTIKNQVIWDSTLQGGYPSSAPYFIDLWVYSETFHKRTVEIYRSTQFRINVTLRDLNNDLLTTGVYADLSPINGPTYEPLFTNDTDLTTSMTFYTTILTLNDSVQSGGYLIPIKATDNAGNSVTGTVQLVVVASDGPIIAFASIEPNVVENQPPNNKYKVRAYVTDRLFSITYVNATLYSLTGQNRPMTQQTTASFYETISITAPSNAGIYPIYINAINEIGQQTQVRINLTVFASNITIEPGTGGGFGITPFDPNATGGASGSAGSQWYFITNKTGNKTKNFQPNEKVNITAFSNLVLNLVQSNLLELYNQSNGKPIVYPGQTAPGSPTDPHPPDTSTIPGTTTTPSSTQAFTWTGLLGGFHVYTMYFYAPEVPGVYPLYIFLKDNSGGVFVVYDTIYVYNEDGTLPTAGLIKTYKNVSTDNTTRLVETSYFQHTDIMYIKVWTKDVDPYQPATATIEINTLYLYMGDIEIKDYFGGTQLKAQPGVTPVSSIYQKDPDASASLGGIGNYTVSVDLLRQNGIGWLPGNNTYILYVRGFNDSGKNQLGSNVNTAETFGTLSTTVWIKAPLSTEDIATGTANLAGDKSQPHRIWWYENGLYWARTLIDEGLGRAAVTVDIKDVDGDGKNDIIAGYWGQKDKFQPIDKPINGWSVAWMKNLLPDGSKWSYNIISYELFPNYPDNPPNGIYYIPQSVYGGDLDGDGDSEVVVGWRSVDDGKYQQPCAMGYVSIFWNDGKWTEIKLTPYETANQCNEKDPNKGGDDIDEVLIADLDLRKGANDKYYPEIIAATRFGHIWVYWNDGDLDLSANSWANGFSGQSFTYNNGKPQKLYGPFMPDIIKSEFYIRHRIRIAPMEGDINNDFTPDIVSVTANQIYIYRNNITDPRTDFATSTLDTDYERVGRVGPEYAPRVDWIDPNMNQDTICSKKQDKEMRWICNDLTDNGDKVPPPNTLNPPYYLASIALADMDGDNRTDILVGTTEQHDASEKDRTPKLWLIRQADPEVGQTTLGAYKWKQGKETSADGTTNGWNFKQIYRREMSDWIVSYKPTGDDDFSIIDIEAGDFDGDGDKDFALGIGAFTKAKNKIADNLYVFMNNATMVSKSPIDPDSIVNYGEDLRNVIWYTEVHIISDPLTGKVGTEFILDIAVGYIDV